MKLRAVAAALALAVAACHHEPVLDLGDRPVGVGGTISGMVRSLSGTALSGRQVTAVETENGRRLVTSTAANGGYTMQVPAGTYRLEVEVRAGENVATHPALTDVNVGDLDAQRDFVLR